MAIAARLRRVLEPRLAGWVRRRQGDDALPVVVHRRRIYILPTRAGVGFTLLLFGMLLAGLNYGNSLALFFTFLLGGFTLAAMYLCHGNLLGATIVGARVASAFAGSAARLALAIDAGRVVRQDLRISMRAAQGRIASPPAQATPAERGSVAIEIPCPRRGVRDVDRISLATTWPFGLFRAWTWLHLPLELVVYPAARGHGLPPRAAGDEPEAARDGKQAGDDEWRGLREYRDGDSPRRIAWKAYARGAALLVRDYAAESGPLLEFDFDRLAPLDLEARLEQLCRWIVDAELGGEPYALRLPQQAIAAGSGAAHRHRCLAALARVRT